MITDEIIEEVHDVSYGDEYCGYTDCEICRSRGNTGELRCLDCRIPYSQLGLDLMLPDEQWLLIHPDGLGGILCANCMMKRAEKLKHATVVLASITK